MKYILWPPVAILITIAVLLAGTLRLILIPLWHFRTIPIKEAYTINGVNLFEDFSWKAFAKDIFVCPSGDEDDEDDEDDWDDDPY